MDKIEKINEKELLITKENKIVIDKDMLVMQKKQIETEIVNLQNRLTEINNLLNIFDESK